MNPEGLAIRLMIGQAALFAAETAIIHELGSDVPIAQLALLRGLAGIALALIMARSVGLAVLRTKQLGLQLLRGGIALLYLWVMIYSFGHLPFADATSISYTQAAYITVFAALILGETITRSRWIAAALGIAGALLIAKPAFAGWHHGYLVALFGTGLNGLSFVLNRYLQREDSEATTMFYTNVVPAVANLPLLAISGASIVPMQGFWWLPGVLLCGPVGVYFGILAVKHASAAMLGPYTLLRLVIAFFGGMILFREMPDAPGAVGACLIVFSCVLSSAKGGFRLPPFLKQQILGLRSARTRHPA